jgi:hypothetical protein
MFGRAIVMLVWVAGWNASAANLEIDVTLSPAGSYKAQTKQIQGMAYKTADGVETSDVQIDLRTLTTGIGLRDQHTRERLLVSKFPEAKLIKARGKNGKGTATIEVKGMKLDVAGTYTVDGKTLKAQFPVKLSDLKIEKVRYMGIGVKDIVVVNIELPVGDAPTRAAANTSNKAKK